MIRYAFTDGGRVFRMEIHDRPGDLLYDDPPAGLPPTCWAGMMNVDEGQFLHPFTVNRQVMTRQGAAWVARTAGRGALRAWRAAP